MVKQNRGPYLSTVRLRPRLRECTAYTDSSPQRSLGRPRISLRSSALTVDTCGRVEACARTSRSAAFARQSGQAKGKSTLPSKSVDRVFEYDAKQALDVQGKIIEQFSDGTLHDITYTSPKAGPVAAYLIVPKGKGPFPAVLFGHWGNETRAARLKMPSWPPTLLRPNGRKEPR